MIKLILARLTLFTSLLTIIIIDCSQVDANVVETDGKALITFVGDPKLPELPSAIMPLPTVETEIQKSKKVSKKGVKKLPQTNEKAKGLWLKTGLIVICLSVLGKWLLKNQQNMKRSR